MANSKSARKRIKVNRRRAERNKSIKSATRTQLKKCVIAFAGNDLKTKEEALRLTVRSLDRAATKGVLRKQTVNRKKSRLAKALNKMTEKAMA